MLRPRPTVIYLSHTDVIEVVHRRRFRRFLEYGNDDTCITFIPTETETSRTSNTSSPSRVDPYRKTPQARGSEGSESPSATDSRIRPLLADPPILLPPDKRVEEDTFPPPEVSSGQLGGSKTDDRQRSVWAPQLCLRPKRAVSPATTTVVGTDTDGSTGSRDPLENPQLESPAHGLLAKKSGVAPTTPRHALQLESFGTPPTAPLRSAHVGSTQIPRPQAEKSLTLWQTLMSGSDVSSPVLMARNPRRLRVYNDSLPALYQPQTPQQLPEARHQSRLHGSYTAPARRTSPEPVQTRTTRPRRGLGHRRMPSPLGLQSPGFRGLYGGMENRDDAGLAEEMAEDDSRSWASTFRPSSSA
ncbi:hypothetical protein C7999DRAFT_13476 [Corynascus novoguineensis]|uniref:Uncharacterized protein n=1 Tax=Corynascus novoguineensis TaxID=1126955 RepID=A0AAN7CWS5_9PEZI|nr:hypothetical protein C7999DRAFT_13476 [Corynascus novoguineensis]